jgi:hypothetical protein
MPIPDERNSPMRKLLALLLVGGSLALPLSAQTTFGVVAGFVSSRFSVSNADNDTQQSRSGFVVGATLSMSAGPGLTFAPEALYAQKGTIAPFDGVAVNLAISYFEIPVLFQYAFTTSGDAKPFITAGPDVAFKVGCNASANGASITCDSDPEDFGGLKSFDYGIVIGVGVTYQRVSLSGRYDMSLANIASDESTSTAHNRALMFVVGVSF